MGLSTILIPQESHDFLRWLAAGLAATAALAEIAWAVVASGWPPKRR
jgi:hypothetical protein